MVAGGLREAIEAGERAVRASRRAAIGGGRAERSGTLAQAANYLGEWEASLAYCRRVLTHAATLDDARVKVVGLYRLGSAYICQGDIEHGLRFCDAALALNPLPFDVAMAKVFRGYGEIRAGRLDAGIAELTEAVAWFDRSHLYHVRVTPALRLAEGYLCRGEVATARALIEDVLTVSWEKGYRYVEGLAHRLLAECLAAELPVAAAQHVAEAHQIFEAIGARNDLAKTLVTRAKLAQSNPVEARGLLEDAAAIFEALGTLDEPPQVSAALAALDQGSPI